MNCSLVNNKMFLKLGVVGEKIVCVNLSFILFWEGSCRKKNLRNFVFLYVFVVLLLEVKKVCKM